MSRLIAVAVAVVAAAATAHAQPAPIASAPDPAALAPAPAATAPPAPAPETSPSSPPAAPDPAAAPPSADDMGDQDISAQLGLATGGHLTPGGLRIAGHYLYQLSDRDWFDGTASFTFGSGGPACFRDRSNTLVCDHGLTDGTGVEVAASIRRMFTPQGQFRPYARLGIGIGAVRFSGDDVSGVAIPLHGGGGVRVKVAPEIAVVAEAELALGFSNFNQGLGSALQLGFAITAGAEFRLR
ncbi:MAG TPA: hypothetical protein VH165_36795 [Kofleriaceae bacterium]|jgi:hypothetical protein|nr:hypothetical protein [Kofleriaceae bacterium]